MLIAMAGLPGTGKSVLARHLATALSAIILDKDSIRAALFAPSLIEYSSQQDDFCQSIMMQVAEYLVCKDPNRDVILDGRPFSRRYQIAALIELAKKLHVPLKILECVCSEETARRRLEQDETNGMHLAKNRNYAMYLSVKARFEPIDEPKLVIDTDNALQQCVTECLSYIREGK